MTTNPISDARLAELIVTYDQMAFAAAPSVTTEKVQQWRDVAAALRALRQRPADAALRAAAKALTDRLAFIHNDASYIGVWSIAQLHVGTYTGPTYTDELVALNAAIASSPPPEPQPRAYTDEEIDSLLAELFGFGFVEGAQPNKSFAMEHAKVAKDRLRAMLRGVTKPPEPQQPRAGASALTEAVSDIKQLRDQHRETAKTAEQHAYVNGIDIALHRLRERWSFPTPQREAVAEAGGVVPVDHGDEEESDGA